MECLKSEIFAYSSQPEDVCAVATIISAVEEAFGTSCELEAALLIMLGYTNKEVSTMAEISASRVSKVRSLLRKLVRMLHDGQNIF